MILDALWPNAYNVMVGDGLCKDIRVDNTEITCLPPSDPFDPEADNPRVRVSSTKDVLLTWAALFVMTFSS